MSASSARARWKTTKDQGATPRRTVAHAARDATLEAVGKLPEDTAGTEENLVLWRENNRRAFAGEKVEEEVTLTIKDEKRDCHNVIAPIIDQAKSKAFSG